MSFSFVSFLHLSLSLSPQVLFCFCSYLLQHFFPSQSCSFSHQDLPSCHYFTAKCQYYGFPQSLILYHLLFVVVLVPVADMFVVMPRFTWKELSFSVSRSEFYCFIDLLTVPGDTFVVMFVSEPDLLILPMILAIFLYLVPNIVIFLFKRYWSLVPFVVAFVSEPDLLIVPPILPAYQYPSQYCDFLFKR